MTPDAEWNLIVSRESVGKSIRADAVAIDLNYVRSGGVYDGTRPILNKASIGPDIAYLYHDDWYHFSEGYRDYMVAAGAEQGYCRLEVDLSEAEFSEDGTVKFKSGTKPRIRRWG